MQKPTAKASGVGSQQMAMSVALQFAIAPMTLMRTSVPMSSSAARTASPIHEKKVKQKTNEYTSSAGTAGIHFAPYTIETTAGAVPARKPKKKKLGSAQRTTACSNSLLKACLSLCKRQRNGKYTRR